MSAAWLVAARLGARRAGGLADGQGWTGSAGPSGCKCARPGGSAHWPGGGDERPWGRARRPGTARGGAWAEELGVGCRGTFAAGPAGPSRGAGLPRRGTQGARLESPAGACVRLPRSMAGTRAPGPPPKGAARDPSLGETEEVERGDVGDGLAPP